MDSVPGFTGIFEEQKNKVNPFALALLVPEAVVKFVDEIPGMGEYNRREYQQKARKRRSSPGWIC